MFKNFLNKEFIQRIQELEAENVALVERCAKLTIEKRACLAFVQDVILRYSNLERKERGLRHPSDKRLFHYMEMSHTLGELKNRIDEGHYDD